MKNPWMVLLPIGFLVALWPRRSTAAGSSSPASSPAAAGSLAAYIQQLHATAQQQLPALRDYWTPDRLRLVTLAAAEYYQIPPEVIWGIMAGESNHRPVGLWGATAANPAGDLAGALGLPGSKRAGLLPSSAYGMIQMTRTRFGQEVAKSGPFGWEHSALINPVVAIWTAARSIRRGFNKHVGPGPADFPVSGGAPLSPSIVPDWLAAWWPGSMGDGAERKRKAIAQVGPKVWVLDGPEPTVSHLKPAGVA